MFIQAPALSAFPHIRHAFFTRQGGVSEGVYASLNGGIGSSDEPERVKENRRRKFEAGLLTKEQYALTLVHRGPEYIAPMVAYLATDEADVVNGQVFHVERGRINTEIFGDDFKFLHKGDDGLFTVDELMETVPASLMSGIVPVVPVVKMADAVSASAAKKEKVG